MARLILLAALGPLRGHGTLRWAVGKPSVLILNVRQCQFAVTRHNKASVADAYRDLAIADVADHIQAFYSRVRRQSHLGGISPGKWGATHGPKRRRKCQTPGNSRHSCIAIVES